MRQSSRRNRLAFWSLLALIQLITIPLQLIIGWGICIPTGLILGFTFCNKIQRPFLAGFLGLSLQWSAYALYRDMLNESLLSARIAQLFGFSAHPIYALLLTGIIGGIMMGSLLLTGSLFGKWVAPKAEKKYY